MAFSRWTRLLSVALPLMLAAALAACGGPAEPAAPAPAIAGPSAEQQQHLQDLKLQLEGLDRQSEAIRREMVSRLDQIDVARQALANQIAGLESEWGGGSAAAPPAAPAPPSAAPPAPAAPEPAALPGAAPMAPPAAAPPVAPADDGENPFLRFLLLIFILGAIFFLGRIFFERWGDGEDGERPSPVETTTDLGKIRFPPGTEARPDEDDHGAASDDENGGRPGD